MASTTLFSSEFSSLVDRSLATQINSEKIKTAQKKQKPIKPHRVFLLDEEYKQLEKLFEQPFYEKINTKFNNSAYTYKLFTYLSNGISELVLGRFMLRQLLGCCGIDTLAKLYVQSNYHKKGIGTLLHKIALRISYFKRHYSFILATDKNYMEQEKYILQKLGFNIIDKFENLNTGNNVNLFSLNLRKYWNDAPVEYEEPDYDDLY